MKAPIILLLLTLGLAQFSWAVIETYQFDTDEQRERYQQFVDELRCPKCQNQNLSGSNSPIAADLRRELHRLLIEGNSDQEVIDYMVSRYGEFVLYRPPVNKQTAVLWFLPALLLAVGILFVVLLIRRRATVEAEDAEAVHRKAQALLAQHEQEQAE